MAHVLGELANGAQWSTLSRIARSESTVVLGYVEVSNVLFFLIKICCYLWHWFIKAINVFTVVEKSIAGRHGFEGILLEARFVLLLVFLNYFVRTF